MEISGADHWFLEGWIGDHAVDFLVDSGSAVIAYCSRALRPSQRKHCTTKREMLAAVSMCIQFRSYLRGAKFTLHTDHKSLMWLHRFKDTEGMMATVPVFYHTSSRAGTWECRRTF